MKGTRGTGVVMVGMMALSAMSGCAEDPKQKIAMLEDRNKALTDDLGGCQNELVKVRGERDACLQDLASARAEAVGCRDQLASMPKEKVPEGWTAVPGGAMIAIQGEFLFDSGKAVIQEGSKKILDEIIRTVQDPYSAKDVMVFGHTDDVQIKYSGWKDNWELSAQRALALVRHFASRGVDPKRLVACGCGEFRPRGPNTSKDAQQKNRRVEIFVLDPQSRTGQSGPKEVGGKG